MGHLDIRFNVKLVLEAVDTAASGEGSSEDLGEVGEIRDLLLADVYDLCGVLIEGDYISDGTHDKITNAAEHFLAEADPPEEEVA